LETEPAKSQDANAPEESDEEPLTGVPAGDTTPSFAQAPTADEGSAEYEPVTPDESFDHGDPVWSDDEPSAPADGEPGAKKTPEWAQTVQTDPGKPPLEEQDGGAEVEEPAATVDSEHAPSQEADPPTEGEPATEPAAEPATEAVAATVPPAAVVSQPPPVVADADEFPAVAITTEPPRAVAADAAKATWPPAAASPAAPPAETDIWPPEPPTEHAMPAWRPPSELEEPATPAQAIPSWPDSFDAVPPAPAVKTPVEKSAAPPAPAAPADVPAPAPQEAPAPAPPIAPASVAPTIPPAAPAPAAHTEPPVRPSQPAPSRPAWAPTAPEEPGAAGTPPKTISPQGPINVPAWAPRVPLASEPGTPTWFSPKEQVRHTVAQPTSQPPPAPQPEPAPPVVGGQLPVAPVPPTPKQMPAEPAAAQPTAKPTWEVVNQPHHAEKGSAGPTPEDRSYAEWFAWAKRGGAPASACHAAAQGAFKALAAGKDVQTAVQWATAAMSRPPENVSYVRQTYCAWFSLANIDLNLDQHRAHAFAMAAVHALDNGADAAQAHAAGLQAAGIR